MDLRQDRQADPPGAGRAAGRPLPREDHRHLHQLRVERAARRRAVQGAHERAGAGYEQVDADEAGVAEVEGSYCVVRIAYPTKTGPLLTLSDTQYALRHTGFLPRLLGRVRP